MLENKILNNINMKYSKDKNDNIDFELDLTSDIKIYYVDDSDNKKSKINQDEINFVNKLIDFGIFLSGFVILYTILKIKNNYKKINFNQEQEIKKLYHKKIYKKI